MPHLKIVGLCLILGCFPLHLYANEVEAGGGPNPIAEANFVQHIQTEVQQKVASGEWTQWQTHQMEALQHYTDQPPVVIGLTPALETRSWFYDPTIIIPYGIDDTNGHLLLAAGSHFNPLNIVTWKTTLIFYDGNNPKQQQWAKQINQQLKAQATFILVDGSISQQAEALQRRVYFDQNGQLIKKLQITHTPALVVQAGKLLKVTEIKL